MAMQPRIMIIGAGGFVGRHLTAALEREYGSGAILATSLKGGEAVTQLDVKDTAAVAAALDEFRATHVVNLAGLAAPSNARRHEETAWQLHVHAAVALGRAMAKRLPDAWLLQVGSGLAYGKTALHGRPIRETEALEPLDPYGVTKAAGDIAIGGLTGEGVKAVRLRPFNHTGPGQDVSFVIPAFASQIARIEAGRQDPVLHVGNLDASRDFLHVADVVSAYAAVIRESGGLTPGIALNVASGQPVRMRDLLDKLLSMSETSIEVSVDPARQRASDVATISGDPSLLRASTGWEMRESLERALEDVLNHFRLEMRAG
jgi:GDP-4-dehydro-6-deoxy-D-mannose reductase